MFASTSEIAGRGKNKNSEQLVIKTADTNTKNLMRRATEKSAELENFDLIETPSSLKLEEGSSSSNRGSILSPTI